MDLDKMKRKKNELGLTDQRLAELSGVPLETVNEILNGALRSPEERAVTALETVLGMNFIYGDVRPDIVYVSEPMAEYGRKGQHTLEDYYALPDHIRAELIDGEFYYMSAPSRVHQKLLGEIYYEIKTYIRKNQGPCEVYLSPFDVFLDRDDKTVVQTDLLVICDRDRLDEKGLNGAPDFAVEIISQSTGKKDYTLKLNKYCNAGVREYWIVDPIKEHIVTYQFEGDGVDMKIWGIRDQIPVGIYGDLVIDFGKLDF